MLSVWAFVMLACGAAMGEHSALGTGGRGQDNPFPLNMAPNSVDDLYFGCRNKMWKVVKGYLENEKKADKTFDQVWTNAEKKAKKPANGLKKEHSMAIYVYTLGLPSDFYKYFNAAVRDQKPQYQTSFKYHALHFLLTDAIQILRSKQKEKCLTTYRRSPCAFIQTALNEGIRFGSFASSSLDQYPSKNFGNKTCFKIQTCLSANVTVYSSLGNHEREALIPPYEVFEVTGIQYRKEKKELECDVEYTLMSAGLRSQLNCAIVK